MLTRAQFVITTLGLAFSRYGKIRFGTDDERPEFSTLNWLTMLFAAGMRVGLLFYGVTEPLTHFHLIQARLDVDLAASHALTVTNFNWAIHPIAIAIGLAGSIAIGVFQIRGGLQILFNLEDAGDMLQYGVCCKRHPKSADICRILN